MRRALRSAGRALSGGQPVRSACVIAAAVGTAALQSSGFGEWWALPLFLVALLIIGARRRR
jgi:hypothetical protein